MHKKLEILMGKFGSFIHDNPIKVILLVLVLLAFPISHAPQIKMDTSTEGFMHDDDPVLLEYNDFRAQFGRDELIILGIRSDNIFTLEFLEKLKKLHEELEEKVPYLSDITSLYNVRNTVGEGDKLITDDLLEFMPKTQEELSVIKKQAMTSHFYKNLLLSSDAKMTTIIIETDTYSHIGEKKENAKEAFEDAFSDSQEDLAKEFLTDAENEELLAKIRDIIKKYESKDTQIFLAGSPVVNNALKKQMKSDMEKFTKATFVIIIIFLFLMFRRVTAVVYPLIVISLSMLTTIGSMAFADVAFKLPTQIVPSLLLAVSIGATVHILSVFFDRFNKTGSKREALVYTMKHSGLAIAMTSVTTAIGIGSFAGSQMAPQADLGIYASLGVIVSLFLTLTLLPALLSISKLKKKIHKEASRLDYIMKSLAVIPVKYYEAIIAISVALVVVALFAFAQLKLTHDPLTWFAEDNTNRVSTISIDKQMKGSVTIEAVIDTGVENGWNNPQRLNTLDKLSAELEEYIENDIQVGKVISIATIVKETNRALHENNENFYTIPKEENLVAQELLLFENSGSDDTEDLADTQFSKARVTIILPWTGAVKAYPILEHIREKVSQAFPDEKVVITGMIPLLINTFANVVKSSVHSYTIAFILISFMMMLILGSVSIGLLSMIPNLTPIVLGLLIMYALKIPLDSFTLLIGSIAIGLAVDDTIHFMHNFKRYYLESKDSAKAIEQTFFTTGKAMLITTIVLSLGFYSYLFGDMIAIQNFGILTGSVIIMALLADILLAPALMIVVAKWAWIK